MSINDRLGILTGGKGGTDVEPLGNQWMFDLVSLQLHEAEEIRRAKEEGQQQMDEEQRYLQEISPRD